MKSMKINCPRKFLAIQYVLVYGTMHMVLIAIYMLNKNSLAVEKVRGQSEARL